jgi:hypothetical protein
MEVSQGPNWGCSAKEKNRAYGRTDEGISPKLIGSTEVSSTTVQTPVVNVGRNMQWAYITDIEEILTFKIFSNGLEKQVACETAGQLAGIKSKALGSSPNYELL